jgi:hypothetical protein
MKRSLKGENDALGRDLPLAADPGQERAAINAKRNKKRVPDRKPIGAGNLLHRPTS